MRLICPNCGAQYEVDVSVIPDAGRDVQCSNCGHTWFQRPDYVEEALADEFGETPAESPATDVDTAVGEDTAEPPAAPPTRRGLDPKVADVLREEAEREAAARRAGGAALETQPDLGLEETRRRRDGDRAGAPRAPRAEPEPVGEVAAAAVTAAAAATEERHSRGAQLPDIDEVDNALQPQADVPGAGAEAERAEAPEHRTRRRRGFRLGFLLTVLIVAAAALVYRYAPQIAERYPPAEPQLIAYVDWVNAQRETVNAALGSAIIWIRELIAGFTG